MRIGILGLGSIGRRHMRNLLELGEQDLFAYDPRIGEAGFSCAPIQGTNSLDLLWAWKPEAILICSPPDTHYNLLSAAALNRVQYLFVEKPLAHSWGYAHMFLECNKDWKLTVAIGYQLRWQLDLACATHDLVWECSQDMSQWLSQYEKDALLEFSHEIDAAVYVNGPVEKVAATESRNGWSIELKHLSSTSTVLLNHRANDFVREAHARNGQRIWTFSRELNDRAYKQELEAFLKVCQGGDWDERLCTLAQAAHVMKIIESCRESVRKCSVVQL